MGKFQFTYALDPSCQKKTYTCGDVLSGEIDLRVAQQVDIKEISVQLTAFSETTYNEKINNQQQFYREYNKLLDISDKVFPTGELTSSSHTFPEKTSHKFRFSVQIPTTCNVGSLSNELLPPSLPNMGHYPATSRICYMFEAKLMTGSFFSLNKTESMVINFCPNYIMDITRFETQMIQKSNHTFEHKIQKFIDSDSGPIENPLEQGHKHTRFIRGIFNENYKSQNYKNLVKDVKLEMSIVTSNFLQPGYTFGPFSVRIFSPVKSLKPDYLLSDGTSSLLGKFSISFAKLKLLQQTQIRAQWNGTTMCDIIDLGKLMYNREFDIANFDKVENGYAKQFELFEDRQVIIPPNILPNFSCGNSQIRRYYHLAVEIHLNSDGKSLKYDYKKEVNIVDMRHWPQEIIDGPPGFIGNHDPSYPDIDWSQPPAPAYEEKKDAQHAGYIGGWEDPVVKKDHISGPVVVPDVEENSRHNSNSGTLPPTKEGEWNWRDEVNR